MMGNIALIEEELGPDSPLLELTEPTLRAIEQASELTNRMLSFARRQPFQLQVINPNKLLNGIEPLLRQALVEEIRIEYSLKAEIWPCRADQGQLEQAILNLAINARDAMPQGGSVRIETDNMVLPRPVEDHLPGPPPELPPDLPPGDYVTISVADTGVGIPNDILQRIFDPFFTTKSAGEGSGLGLSMVHGFANQSNGDISVTSEVGAGTTFRLYLPRAENIEDDAGTVDDEPDAPAALAENETILVIEDEADVQLMVARSLKKLGYHVLTADAGQAGLDVLEKHGSVDLLVTDILLPGGLNGQQVADLAGARHPDLRVLFMSGYARDAIIDQGRLRPDVRLLSKPFVPSELGQRVREILDES